MPAGYRAGIPQQPYTKYESDNEEIKVEYKRVDSIQRMQWFGGFKGSILRVLLVIIIFMMGLILGYVIRRTVREAPSQPEPSYADISVKSEFQAFGIELSHKLSALISGGNIEQNLKNYSQEVHISGVHSNNHLGAYLHQQLQLSNLIVKETKYNVLLSYHNWERPNVVQLISANGTVVYQTEYRGPLVNGDSRSADHPEITQSYAAYAPNGSAEGEIVYANYGEEKDFQLLAEKGVSCRDRIVIMRTGQIFLGHMVRHAEECGASAVLLYPDPSDVVENDVELRDAFPRTRSLPGWATQRGSLWRFGDPLTPGFPSKDGVFRIRLEDAGLPKIPVQPISYDDALRLMSFMTGPLENDFIGSMHGNISYSMGPGYTSPQEQWKVRVDVSNDDEKREITNIIGMIKGLEEPDSYVLVGCHYDSWSYGAVDPSTGIAVLIELARAFDKLVTQGWLPQRTIVFALWDAGEMGQVGSFEWVEDYELMLLGRVVAYVNLDEAVSGSHVFDAESSPLLRELLMNASKRVPSFVSNAGYDSLYDLWARGSPSENDNTVPRVFYPSPDSDHAPFLYFLGAPVVWPRFMDAKFPSRSKQYPARHAAVDKYEYVKRFIDPTFVAHETFAQFVGELVLQLASSPKLPLDVRELAETLEQEYNSLQQDGMEEFKSSLDHLQWAIRNFTETAALFYDNFQHLDLSSSLELRQFNRQVTRLSAAFVPSNSLHAKPQIRNVLFAPSELSSYPYSTFTRIHDAFETYLRASSVLDRDKTRHQLEQQFSITTLAVQTANRLLETGDILL